MKAIVCEMCSSRDFAKQDGFYICQKCGMKYSSEEARKLMVDVPEDEAAPVDCGSAAQSEGSAELSNFLTIARRAKDEGNSERAEKYYDLVLQLDPNNWEANFYSVYYSCNISTNFNCCRMSYKEFGNTRKHMERFIFCF